MKQHPLPERPLSPHLQIYRPQVTSVLSILHRATGAVLVVGLFVLALWLIAGAAGEDAYDLFAFVAGSPLGVVVLMGWSYALFYHLCTGIRHLIFDTGLLVTMPGVYKSGYWVLGASVVLTFAFWLGVLYRMNL